MVQLRYILQSALLLLLSDAWANPVTGSLEEDPTSSAASIEHYNATDSLRQLNLLDGRSAPHLLSARQLSCPNPSTNSLCESNFCFVYQQNSDGTAWATCCPVGWVLQLNAADWTKQKCVLNGVSEAPLRPLSCGGNINGVPGTTSGWACVYSNQNINGVGSTRHSSLLIIAVALAWLGLCVL